MGRGPSTQYHLRMNDAYVMGTLTCIKPEIMKKRCKPSFPLVLNIEPTNRRNSNCYICIRQKSRLRNQDLAFDLFKKAIDEVASHGKLIMINLHKNGEPLLNNNIFSMIGYIKDRNASKTVHFNTNGILLAKENVVKLMDSGIDDVTISIDASRRETYEKIKRVKGFEELENNIRNFFKIKNSNGKRSPHTRVKIMEYKDTWGEIDEFVRKWKDIADEVQVTGVHNWSENIEGLETTDEKKDRRYPCCLLWYELVINADGSVSPCQFDWKNEYILGNIKNNTIANMWNGEKIQNLRRAQVKKDWKYGNICEKCITWAGGEDMSGWYSRRKDFYE
jgi:radical SAM protein with 4Fe4S-binding SPASM domain